jgi:3-phosphoshikimate 1-carboxyvinyltransferase
METLSRIVRICPSELLKGTAVLPSSKYHTLRAILAATLATGTSTVCYPARSDDTAVLLDACGQLGAHIQIEAQADGRCILSIRGTGGRLEMPPGATLDAGNAGAVLRLLLGICAVLPEAITFTTPYPESLGRRPNADLLQALAQLGVVVESQTAAGTLPVTIRGGHLRGGKVQVSGKKSSQYISSLLFLGPLLEEGLDIEIIDGLTSASFVDLTIQFLTEAGITVLTRERYRRYVVPGQQRYQPQAYVIPGDWPSAAALLAAVAVAKGEITFANFPPDDTNGAAILEVFAAMGVPITRSANTVIAWSHGPLHGVTFDGNRAIDSVPAIVAAACFADGQSHIANVANLRLKESDRIDDLAMELNKAGCHVIPADDAITVYPVGLDGIAGGVDLDAHADHRLIAACAIVGLGSKHPITIANADHVAKSYPHFFADLANLGAKIEPVLE